MPFGAEKSSSPPPNEVPASANRPETGGWHDIAPHGIVDAMPSSSLILLAAAGLSAPTEPLAGLLRAAIWNDLQLNAMIGSGNRLASLWYNAAQEDAAAPRLHILDLSCRSNREGHRCAFTLLRDGGVGTVFDETAPDRLGCSAQFVRDEESGGWTVRHRPPRGAGHTRTDMQCEAAPPG